MSMETFQNVDEWLISTDVSSLLASCWKEAEQVPGLDDDDDTSDLTPTCTADGFRCYDITDCLNSPVQNPSSECWLDINEVMPCDGKMSDCLFTEQTGDRRAQTNEFGVELSTSLAGDGEELARVSIGELESLLLMDTEAENGRQLAGYVTVDSGGLGSLLGNTKMQFDSVHRVVEKEPAKVSHDVDDCPSSSSEEDDTGDATWSHRTGTTRRLRRRRPRPVRRLSAVRNRTADEHKKQQNKTAATRYREKKRAEEMENELLCAALEKRNKELSSRVQEMTQEVAVLRQLVIDVFRSPDVGSS